MRCTTLSVLVLAALTGCPGGDAGIGETCTTHTDCESNLQCVSNVCAPRCQRAPDCGDGYVCERDGFCRLATGRPGDACTSEVDCGPGLSCQIDGEDVDDTTGYLRASCTAHAAGRPPGEDCVLDGECRNGTCALGHCVDLCAETRDCGTGTSCMDVPRVEAVGALFRGCLPAQGTIAWPIPVIAPDVEVQLPVPSGAAYASLVFSVDDAAQRVGATQVLAPTGELLFQECRRPLPGEQCTAQQELEQYYGNLVRHAPQAGQSVLAMPSNPAVALQTGSYRVRAKSIRPNGTSGSAIPKVTAVVRIGTGVLLDLHLYFLDLDDHPCQAAFGNARLEAAAAGAAPFFQTDFLGQLRAIFAGGGIALGSVTYHDVLDHPDLDGLDIADAGALLALGSHDKGINVFFVRTLSPVGLQAIGPSPGPAGLASTRASGLVIGLDTLCYRSWQQLARLTAHEIARYMGLYHNVEIDPQWHDAIADSDDAPANLMFYSELGGTDLSAGQRDILTRSPVLR